MRGLGQRNEAFFQPQTQERGIFQAGGYVDVENLKRRARQTGVIDLSRRNLNELAGSVFELEDLDEDEKFWEILPTTKVDLSQNGLAELPESLCLLVDVVHLQLRNNRIEALPAGLFLACDRIQLVDISSNKLRKFDATLGNLRDLKELNACGNLLDSVPSTIADCSLLQTLNISDNQITWLPDTFRNLASVVHMNLSRNRLKSLPDIGAMKNLSLLDISWNCLQEVIDLTALHNLTFLDVAQNRLNEMPRVAPGGHLARIYVGNNSIIRIDVPLPEVLSELRINDNRLEAVSHSVLSCQQLKSLDVRNNNITDLPPGLGYMDQLQRCALEGNPIRSIRRSLLTNSTDELKKYLRTRGGHPLSQETSQSSARSNLSPVEARLRDVNGGKLNLAGLNLARIPHEVSPSNASLSHVFEGIIAVDMSNNGIIGFPHELLMFLPNLKELNLSKNQLWKGADGMPPPASHSSPSIRNLNLSSNGLISRHIDNILEGYVGFISVLVLADNKVEHLPACIERGNASNLFEMDLTGNLLQRLELAHVHVPCLETLLVANNQISTMDNLMGAPRLKTLALDNNSVRDVPIELALLPLTNMTIYGNPLANLRQHQIQSTDSILKVLKTRLQPRTGAGERKVIATVPYSIPAPVSAPAPAPAAHKNVFKGTTDKVEVLTDEVSKLSDIIEGSTLTSTELRLAKKQLAIKRANLMRLTRQNTR